MNIPFFRSGHHSLAISLVLLMTLTLLMLTGLGVFRLYFDFDWTAGYSNSGELFSVRIKGGRSLNLFEAAPFGSLFWGVLALLVGLCLVLPLFRILGGSMLTLLIVSVLFVVHGWHSPDDFMIPLEYELVVVLVLYIIYVLLTLMVEMREQKRVGKLLSRFVPEELADEFRRDPDALVLSGEERTISVLFCDVRDFSSVTQTLDTPSLAQWLNLYFNHVSQRVIRHRGTIDKYIGDSVMAVWGSPLESRTHAFDALHAAIDIQQELDVLNALYRDRGWPEVSIGIGVSSGPAMVGPLGSEFRMDYTVVGDTVNVAQRLEDQTRKYHAPVIVSDNTAHDLPDWLFRELDTIEVKGRPKPVAMYEPVCAREDASETLLEQLDLHHQAMQAGKSGQWQKAQHLFSALRDQWGPSARYELYLRGVEAALATQAPKAEAGSQAYEHAMARRSSIDDH